MTSTPPTPDWADIWPVFGITITTPRLVLRALTPDVVHEVLDVALAGIHDPSSMPFAIPWTDQPPDRLKQEAWRWWSSAWTNWSVDGWAMAFVATLDGAVIGVQDINAATFPVRRTVVTGSWLGRGHQGQGLGKEMRAGVLTFAFDGISAERAETSAWLDNAASRGVTAAMGYRPDGTEIQLRRGEAAEMTRFTLTAGEFRAAGRTAGIELGGLTPEALAMFGLDPPT